MAATLPKSSWNRDRFYLIDGQPLPSVTTVLEIIAKPALGPRVRQGRTSILRDGDAGGPGPTRRPRSRVRPG
jgi:hypothetical protein